MSHLRPQPFNLIIPINMEDAFHINIEHYSNTPGIERVEAK